MFDRRLLQYFDWGLLALASIIGGIGLFTLYSAVTAETPEPQKIIFYKQLIWFSAALVAMTVSFSINYKLLDRWGQILYIGCILLLIWVLFFGKYVGGSRRWLILPPRLKTSTPHGIGPRSRVELKIFSARWKASVNTTAYVPSSEMR